MKKLFNLPLNVEIFRNGEEFSVQKKRRTTCDCGGKLLVHSKRERSFRHSFVEQFGVVWLHYIEHKKRCTTCKKIIQTDLGLGVRGKASENYRQIVLAYIKKHTYRATSERYGISTSTIIYWINKWKEEQEGYRKIASEKNKK